MTDTSPTLWSADPHTLAKHAILKGYLHAWMPKVSRTYARSRRYIDLIDGFAGPGEYTGGEPGSPIIAARAAIEHVQEFPIPIRATFIDIRPDRVAHLRGEIEKLPTEPHPHNVSVQDPICGDCAVELQKLMDSAGQGRDSFGPALAFLDQFGYGEVPMSLIRNVLRFRSCEVFTYLNYSKLSRFISDERKWSSITGAWGGDEWKEALSLADQPRHDHLRETYRLALRNRGGAKYVCDFTMHDEFGKLLYWLFFCTENIQGLYEMKRSMWGVDETGCFRFSDRHAGQPALLKFYDARWLAGALKKDLAGKTLAVAQVEEQVLTDTPCYLFKPALKHLEKNGTVAPIDPPEKRQSGTYADEKMRVRFA